MWVKARPFAFGQEFIIRFVAASVCRWLPLLTTVFVFSLASKSSFAPWFAVKYTLFMGLVIWMALQKAPGEQRWVERLLNEGSSQVSLVADSPWDNLLPLAAACAFIGLIGFSLSGDWRWALTSLGLLILLRAGSFLKWLIYDRWVAQVLVRCLHQRS